MTEIHRIPEKFPWGAKSNTAGPPLVYGAIVLYIPVIIGGAAYRVNNPGKAAIASNDRSQVPFISLTEPA